MASCIHNHACICAYKLSYSSSWNIGFSTSCTYNTQLRKKKKQIDNEKRTLQLWEVWLL
jgi:hypothetical protein